MSLKQRLKSTLKAHPRLWVRYLRVKRRFHHVWTMRYCWQDLRNVYRSMHWDPASPAHAAIAAELLFQYHKLEKGMSMPPPRRLFGLEPSDEVMQLLTRWRHAGLPLRDPIYRGAIETLHAYVEHVNTYQLDPTGQAIHRVRTFLADVPDRCVELTTPIRAERVSDVQLSTRVFSQLVRSRRSVRYFSPKDVSDADIDHAVSMAQSAAPSACNRQPSRVYVFRDEQRKGALLRHQNGNRGFGHTIPVLLIITVDEACFFDASERHQPYIDGGLFSMALCLAFTAQGLSTCCLNWCVAPSDDSAAHDIARIPPSERIIMYMGLGHAHEECRVPRSPRRELAAIVRREAMTEASFNRTGTP